MPLIKFTSALTRFFPKLQPLELQGETVKETIDLLEEQHPGIKAYLVDDQGQLRQHVNVFIGSEMVKDRQGLADPLNPGDEVYIMQALSGG